MFITIASNIIIYKKSMIITKISKLKLILFSTFVKFGKLLKSVILGIYLLIIIFVVIPRINLFMNIT